MTDLVRLAKVVNCNPQAHSVDVVMLDTLDRVSNVQVVATYISTNSGELSLPSTTQPSQAYSVQNTGKTDVFAWVVYSRNVPLVIGFKVPEIGQMTFADGRRIFRHDSDVYSSIDLAGNYEMYFPNGTFFRVGTSASHEDLTGRDYDGLWKIAKNLGAELYVTFQLPGGVGGFTMDPKGNLISNAPSWEHTGDLDVTGSVSTSGNVSVGTGASGSFTSGTGQTVMVIDGVIVNIY